MRVRDELRGRGVALGYRFQDTTHLYNQEPKSNELLNWIKKLFLHAKSKHCEILTILHGEGRIFNHEITL